MNGNTVHQDFYNHTVEILGAIQEKVRVELGGHEGTDWNVIELFLNLLMSIDLADDHTGFCDLIIFTMAISPSMVMLRRLPDESANLWWRFAIMFHNDEYQISTAGHFVVMHEAMTLKYCPQIFYEWKHWTRKALWSIVKSEVTKVSQPRADTMRYDPAVLFTFRKMTAVLSKLEGLQGFTNESPTFVGREEELTEVRRLLGSKELTDKQLSDYQRYCHRILKDLRDKSASVTLESILR
ncbi:hypothetical protein K491DRAFT_699756 [Lophiostoma macrostomum CBS 122681]|uniref:Uncharacterized protein n=1 Tax=Lophiostoma macrostomum CBS 122681 TaxID=1314788 RepID=A0A6A6SJU2_9PLEO|nr:hypothetical protein K491DRAFT_699756 [Lophiostoma macrostomum CBS 122681]